MRFLASSTFAHGEPEEDSDGRPLWMGLQARTKEAYREPPERSSGR